MLKKLLAFFGYHVKTYTFSSPSFGGAPIHGIASWRVKGGAIIANTPSGKVIVFPLSGTPFIEISGGGIKKTIKVESVSTEVS